MPGSKPLAEKTLFVTGASRGIGLAIALKAAADGANIAIAAKTTAPHPKLEGTIHSAAAAIEAAGGRALPLAVDIRDEAAVKDAIDRTAQTFGGLDIVVNNAGTTHRNQPMLDVDEATFDRVFATNVKSLYLSAKHTVPVFRAHGGGVIVNIASTAGVRPRPGLTWYNGSKGAAILLTRSMAAELAPDRIRVNAINPVMGETGLLKDFLPGEDSAETRQKVINTIPLGRLSRPEDIAKAAAFLASDDADFITGVCMEVDGGRCV